MCLCVSALCFLMLEHKNSIESIFPLGKLRLCVRKQRAAMLSHAGPLFVWGVGLKIIPGTLQILSMCSLPLSQIHLRSRLFLEAVVLPEENHRAR